MKALIKISLFVAIFLISSQVSYAQSSCCPKGSKESINCTSNAKTSENGEAKTCCSTNKKESTSGCTPSNCRGAKTKFGEAKVISELRLELVSLKAKMEKNNKLKFSEASISVHDIIGETDEESLEIITKHVEIIESEISSLTSKSIQTPKESKNKAVQVKQLKERISILFNML